MQKHTISLPELKLNADAHKEDNDKTLENEKYDSPLAYEPMLLQE